MNNALRAANYLVLTNQDMEARDAFTNVFAEVIDHGIDMDPFGMGLVFKDESVLLALHTEQDGDMSMIVTDMENRQAAFVSWVMENDLRWKAIAIVKDRRREKNATPVEVEKTKCN